MWVRTASKPQTASNETHEDTLDAQSNERCAPEQFHFLMHLRAALRSDHGDVMVLSSARPERHRWTQEQTSSVSAHGIKGVGLNNPPLYPQAQPARARSAANHTGQHGPSAT